MSTTSDPDLTSARPPVSNPRTAEVWPRAVARLIDHVALALVTALVLVPLGLTASLLGGPAGFLASAVAVVSSSALTVGYFAVSEARGGQTVGKRLLGVRVVDGTGAAPALGVTLRRNAWTGLGVVSVVPVVGGLIGGVATLVAVVAILAAIAADPERRGWHDRFAGGTRVVVAG